MRFARQLRYKMDEVMIAAHVHGAETGAKGRRAILLSGFAYNMILNLVGGAYLSGLCLEMGASPNQINTIILIITCCSMGQLASPMLLQRVGNKKSLLIGVRAVSHAMILLAVPLVALLMPPGSGAIITLSVLLGLSNLIQALVGPGIQAWHIAIIPPRMQLGYFSLSSTMNVLMSNAALYFGAMLTDLFTGLAGRLEALAMMRFLLLILAAADIIMLLRIPQGQRHADGDVFSLGMMLRCIRENPLYMRTIGVICIWSLVVNLPSQYYTAYLLDDLKVSYMFISLVNVFTIFAVIFLIPIYKRLIERYSVRRVIAACIGCMFPYTVALFWVMPGTAFLYPIGAMYSVMCTIGLTLCFAVIPYQNLPEKNQTVLFALYNTMSVVSTMLGVYIGRLLYDLLGYINITLGGISVAPARSLLLIEGVLFLLGAALVLKLMKKQPTPEIQAE